LQLAQRGSCEGALTLQRFEQRDCERELIRARVGGFAEELLGCHVRRGADDGACAREDRARVRVDGGAALRGPREAEVTDAHAAVAAHEHVFRLEVAMHEAGCMRGCEPVACRDEHLQHSALAPRCAQPVAQRRAVHELHRDEELLALRVGADVVDRDNVGVGELGHRAGLARQPISELGALGTGVGMQDLDRHSSIELGVVRREHGPHAAFPQAAGDAVAADGAADLWQGRFRPGCGDRSLVGGCWR
jgi:hypothetical protein